MSQSISLESLIARKKDIENQKKQAEASVLACNGALQILDILIDEIDKASKTTDMPASKS